MARAFCIPGIVFLFCALVLSVLVSISLPSIRVFDIIRTDYNHDNQVAVQLGLEGQIRYGIWAPCFYGTAGLLTKDGFQNGCLPSHHGYNFPLGVVFKDGSNDNDPNFQVVEIKSSWTRGLAVHPVAAGVTFVAFVLSFSTHLTVTLISSVTSFLAALLTLIAFAIDIALLVLVKNANKKFPEVNGVKIDADTHAGAGFWMTFVTFILLLLAGCTVCFGHRRSRTDNMTTTEYPMYKKGLLGRFRM